MLRMNKIDILRASTFGSRIAEDESDALESYFVETEHWRKVIGGTVDVVYGPKGSGKSAIYQLLRAKRDDLMARDILPAAGETLRGTPAFEALVTDPPASEEHFRGLWKLYFLSLIGSALRIYKVDNAAAKRLAAILEEAKLVSADEWSPRKMLRSVLDYVRRFDFLGEIKLNPTTELPEGISGKITLREPATEQGNQGYVSVDTLWRLVDKALEQAGKKFWIVLDRLDVAFADSSQLETNGLRALFRVYRDISARKNVVLKIFLRDDIWARITEGGFREASHVTRTLTITWDRQALLNLVVRRVLYNEAIRAYYRVDLAAVLKSTDEQERLFYRVFPPQVDKGKGKSTTLDWLLTRTADGTGQTAPRELIHLLSSARDEQIRLLEMGVAEPEGEALFDRTALRAALPQISRVRFEQTLCAEHPALRPILLSLQGKKTQQTPATLSKAWGVTQEKALANAEKLVEVGFFEKRGSREQPAFWVPFLYRDALQMVQGVAK
jgi:hypothetical protein